MSKKLAVLLFVLGGLPSFAQTIEEVEQSDLYEMSLEELMNITIVSASRSEEKAFEAPLSSFAISQNEILNSGATSIPEALRLCPGLFVKQMVNGVYDVSIRGMDNLPSHQFLNTNKLILVMINNRPVFDYLSGNTFWQNLPIDIIDVDRIEIVLGPSAPLYGPNAVTGVINIITKNPATDGVSATANVQAGTPDSFIGQAWIGYSANKKIDITASVNHSSRGRGTVDYYDLGKREFVTDQSEISDPEFQNEAFRKQFFPDPEIGLNKTALNVGFRYSLNDQDKIDLSAGYLTNEALYGSSVYLTSSYASNKSTFGMVKADLRGFSFLGAILKGNQGLLGDLEAFQYDYRNLDAYLDYNFQILKNLSLRPAVSFQSSTINDEPYTVEKGMVGVFNNKATMDNYAASLKVDFTVGKLRLIGAIRGDRFRYPDDNYVSYQGLINYKLGDRQNLRAIIAKSNGGSFIQDTYLNNSATYPPTAEVPIPQRINTLGNKDRTLAGNKLFEIGYRAQIRSTLQLDIAVFRQVADGFTGLVRQAPVINPVEGVIDIDVVNSNLDVKAVQNGVTLALNWVAAKNTFNLKPFITIQKTEWQNYSPFFLTPDAHPVYNVENQQDVESKATPGVYGGFYANYAVSKKLNLNINGYLMSEYEIFSISTNRFQEPPYNEYPISYIDGKFILNAKVGYQINRYVNIFASARNALNNDSREYFGTDKIGAMYLGGVHISL